MSTYDTIKAKHGAGPAYPSRSDFTTVYGYKAGKALGEFPDVAAAKAAGAATTDKSVDQAGYDAAMGAYRAHQQAIIDEWMDAMRAENSDLPASVFDAVYSMAYDRGHSAGYGEVELYIDDYADFARKVRAAA